MVVWTVCLYFENLHIDQCVNKLVYLEVVGLLLASRGMGADLVVQVISLSINTKLNFVKTF